MRVARLELKGIGPFEDAVLEIPPPEEGQRGELVLFEGPNGSGKTTIAQAIACLLNPRHTIYGPPEEKLFPLMPPFRELLGRIRTAEPRHPAELHLERAGEERLAQLSRRNWVEWSQRHAGARSDVDDLVVRAQEAASGKDTTLTWAAFAFRGHQPTPIISTKGPAEIETPPLRGALSFGAFDPASAQFGQLLTNLHHERATAFMEAHRDDLPADRRAELQRSADTRRDTLARMEEALSSMLDRAVRFEFPLGQHHPNVLFDGELVALDLLGEGMRSTLAWLTDLLVRLHRIRWADPERSPLEQDFWLILDEIDESLHPRMQMRILPALRRLFPNARLYITTHSPFVVASAAEGYVFSIRPDHRRRVSGRVEPRKLEPGQSLEWVVEEIFDADTGLPRARPDLEQHLPGVLCLQYDAQARPVVLPHRAS